MEHDDAPSIFGVARRFCKPLESNPKNDVDASHNKLLATFMNAVGVPTTHFGAADLPSGELPQLKLS